MVGEKEDEKRRRNKDRLEELGMVMSKPMMQILVAGRQEYYAVTKSPN